jgi:hypothetical protein
MNHKTLFVYITSLLNAMAEYSSPSTSMDKEVYVVEMDKEQLLKEYELILQKKSDLSASKRLLVLWRVRDLYKQKEV